MWTALLIMVLAGLLGGSVTTGLSQEDRNRSAWRWNALIGIGAALLVPLFLQTVSSSLMKELLNSEDPAQRPEDFLIFGGFALLAAISSRRFISSLTERVLREIKEEVKEAKQVAHEAKSELVETRSELVGVAARSEQTRDVALAANDAARYGLMEIAPGTPRTASALPVINPGPLPDDPWKGQFGGSPDAQGRKVEARIQAVPDRPGWCSVALRVTSTDTARPLDGQVQFYLHPSFGGTVPLVPVRDGQAVLAFTSWGAFTVGVLTDDGHVALELDLAEHPDAPEPWRSR